MVKKEKNRGIKDCLSVILKHAGKVQDNVKTINEVADKAEKLSKTMEWFKGFRT